MLKHIIFDFDGTIADSEEVCFKLLNEIARRHGYRPLGREEFVAMKELTYPERLQYLGVSLARLPFLSLEARRHYRLFQEDLKPYPGIRQMLLTLREEGYRLHVLSSNAVANIRSFLLRHDLDVFESVTCERSFFGKHIGLRRVLESRGLRASEAIYVADEIRDIDACRKIDLRVISVSWGFDLAGRLGSANPGMLAQVPGDVLDLLSSRAVCRIEVEPVTALTPAAVGLAS